MTSERFGWQANVGSRYSFSGYSSARKHIEKAEHLGSGSPQRTYYGINTRRSVRFLRFNFISTTAVFIGTQFAITTAATVEDIWILRQNRQRSVKVWSAESPAVLAQEF